MYPPFPWLLFLSSFVCRHVYVIEYTQRVAQTSISDFDLCLWQSLWCLYI